MDTESGKLAAKRAVALHPNLSPKAICRRSAAEYAGISASKFDELVREGRMPPPRKIDRRRVWLVSELDRAIYELPADVSNGRSEWNDCTWKAAA